ncbi:MAG TPA: GNAT family N-acetyltransferase [Polyangiaceae bacterium]|nr:GNAT family N-acetyltransferase [Polyangiaceae bacterium]
MSGGPPAALVPLNVEPVRAHHGPALVQLFERTDCPCFCQYQGFAGDGRDWQNRCANERSVSRDALLDDLAHERLIGSVASAGDELVGWVRVERAARLPKVYEGRVYRGLPCFTGDRAATWAISCFLVSPDWRRRGVSSALLSGAIDLARQHGAASIEAFPRGARDTSDEEQWTGPLSLYERAGFEVVSDFAAYPVLRLSFASVGGANAGAAPSELT